MLEVTLWIAVILLLYIWFGYHAVLEVASRLVPALPANMMPPAGYPKVSIIVAAYDEEKVIAERLQNLLQLDYPSKSLEIIIASDGSTDNTVKIARTFEAQGIRILEFSRNRGRADVHNDSVYYATGEIVVFTDADTSFDSHCISELVRPFSDQEVGAVIGQLCYRMRGTAISQAEGFYWERELRIKELEQKLGIVNNGLGACMAIRKTLFRQLKPFDDVDTATIIDVLFAGYKVIYQKTAIAYDSPPSSALSELSMRIRGTAKTVTSLCCRMKLHVWLQRPLLTWSIFSHRGLRYTSGILMVIAFIANVLVAPEHLLYQATLVVQFVFYGSAIIGAITDCFGKNVFLVSLTFSFCLAMTGMTLGLAKAIAGRAPSSYKTE